MATLYPLTNISGFFHSPTSVTTDLLLPGSVYLMDLDFMHNWTICSLSFWLWLLSLSDVSRRAFPSCEHCTGPHSENFSLSESVAQGGWKQQ